VTGEKRCRICGQTKPLDQYHRQSGTADGRDPRCKDCANARVRPPSKVIEQRARQRAAADLIANHRDEFERLYAARLSEAQREARHLATAATADANPSPSRPASTPATAAGSAAAVVRLKPGPRGDQSVVERIREQCPECATYHERGHQCPTCAERDRMKTVRPAAHQHQGDPKRAEAIRLLRAGHTIGEVATALGMSETWAGALLALLRKDGAA
jgi:hypothetical protein